MGSGTVAALAYHKCNDGSVDGSAPYPFQPSGRGRPSVEPRLGARGIRENLEVVHDTDQGCRERRRKGIGRVTLFLTEKFHTMMGRAEAHCGERRAVPA